ncbi:MAG: hypothetical protein VR64_25140 [Desulfatitalea sp. BRH_c12]|nr:MAG: hypothetical protein VR64_25140 [Desulfatitalea sp. BRH_c12]
MTAPIRIMIVEDDMNVATVLEARLQSFGYQVCGIARTGSEAMRSTLEHRPDLVLMDILLSGDMNGIEAAELIQKQQIAVPIVFVTCLSDQHMLDRAVQTNAYGYILKPYDNAELKYTIQIALIKFNAAKEREILIKKLVKALADRKRATEALLAANETLEQKVNERTREEKARSKQLQALAVELIEAEERERRRISELLHDDLQQILAAARLQLECVCANLPHAPGLSEVERMLSESICKARQLSHEISPAVLQHSDLVSAMRWLCQNVSEQFKVNVKLNLVKADQLQDLAPNIFVFRAVQELLFNIFKHAGVKSACVDMGHFEDGIIVTVSDEGKGFDPDILDANPEKAGLGLLSLRERASYIGGSLTIESAKGRGSRFTLTCPMQLYEADSLQIAEGYPAPTPVKAIITDSACATRVLFVDDHKVMRQGLIRLISEQPDIQVVGEAANGLEAFEIARQLQPDVIVMDISMPEMDGIEATRRIKAELPDVRVIGLSMHDNHYLSRTLREAGIEAFVSKAASSSALLKAIYGIKG